MKANIVLALSLSALLWGLHPATPTVANTPTAVTLSSFTAHVAGDNTNDHILLTWTTASEINTAGFNIYRSERKEGPFSRINSQLISASPDSLSGGSYQYHDTNIERGKAYYYQLEDVELNGTSVRHKPITIGLESQVGFDSQLQLGIGIAGLLIVTAAIIIVRRRIA